jgi:transposase
MQLHSTKLRIKNKKFYDRLKGIKKEHILGIAIDWAKNFHKVMLFDFNGKILVKPFEIDTLRKGYDKLINTIRKQEQKIRAKKVFIIIEPSGSWAYSLITNLGDDFEELWLVNPYQTASNRKEKMVIGLKTDDIDLCSLSDLLIRGECYKYVKEKEVYTQLKLRAYWRQNKIEIRTRLLNQICHRLGKIYPAVTLRHKERSPFREAFNTTIFKHLLHLNKTPTEVLSLDKKRLEDILQGKTVQATSRYANIIIRAFSKYLAPRDAIVKMELEILAKDLRLYEIIDKEIKVIENEMLKLVHYTEGKYLLNQIPGITDIMIASYIGIVGSVHKYENAKKIFSLSGLAPKIKESGGRVKKAWE